MPRVSGYLRVTGRGGASIDNELPEGDGGLDIDNSLPSGGHPWVPGHLPPPPPGTWPPPNSTLPIVPAPPDTPPGAIWPPIGNPPIWSGGVTPPVRPGNELPNAPVRPGNELPGGPSTMPTGKFWVVVGIPGVGWRYACIQPAHGRPGNELPDAPVLPGTPLPPVPEPKK